jgi:hypothetical protein
MTLLLFLFGLVVIVVFFAGTPLYSLDKDPEYLVIPKPVEYIKGE